MTKFEYMINDGKMEARQINCIIIDLEKNETFDAWINAKSLSEVDSKLPLGCEMDRITTLGNYFDHKIINKFEIELANSQHIYFSDFEKLYEGGLYRYTDALDREDYNTTQRLDSRFQG